MVGESWWKSARYGILDKVRAVFGLDRGQVMPWYVMVIACLLFPGRGVLLLCEKVAPVGYSLYRDALNVDGYWVDIRALVAFAHYPKGTVFEVVDKDKKAGLITLRVITPPAVYCGPLPKAEDLWPGKITQCPNNERRVYLSYPEEGHS